MATHSSMLAWKILWTGEPGRLYSMGSQLSIHIHNVHRSAIYESQDMEATWATSTDEWIKKMWYVHICVCVCVCVCIHSRIFSSFQLLSHVGLCDPMNRSTPGLPVHHQLPEFAQTPLSRWRHPTISSSVIPFSSCLQSFPISGSFPMSQLFASGGQNIGVSASASVLPMNTQDWSPLGWTGWISLQSKGLSRVFSNTTV